MLEKELQNAEDQYRHFAMKECDMDEESVYAKIMNARSAPQKNARLQRIHKAHKDVMTAKKERYHLSV